MSTVRTMAVGARVMSSVAAALVLVLVSGCGGGGVESSASDDERYDGPPSCSQWANGEKITEKLKLTGCEDTGTTSNASAVCTADNGKVLRLTAVGPVYGIVGQPAKYLGKGEDATTSPEWEKLQQDCSLG